MSRNQRRSVLQGAIAVMVVLMTSRSAGAQDGGHAYPAMAPVEQYLMDRGAEIALARSAAPDAISRDASVLVLTRHGYETAAEGKNGWVCWVGRGWLAMFDHPEFWSAKVRAADCLNPPAARSLLPYAFKRAELLMAGHSKQDVIAAIKAGIERKELPPLEPGGISYMMSKSSYLTDYGHHNGAHLMFFQSGVNETVWGANLTNSPIAFANYWYISAEAYPQLKGFPPLSVFLVGVDKWSDGTPAPAMQGAPL